MNCSLWPQSQLHFMYLSESEDCYHFILEIFFASLWKQHPLFLKVWHFRLSICNNKHICYDWPVNYFLGLWSVLVQPHVITLLTCMIASSEVVSWFLASPHCTVATQVRSVFSLRLTPADAGGHTWVDSSDPSSLCGRQLTPSFHDYACSGIFRSHSVPPLLA